MAKRATTKKKTTNLNDEISNIEQSLPLFNDIDNLKDFISAEKVEWFKNLGSIWKVVILGAKDTGKSFPADMYKLYCMEHDPYASVVTMMKHTTLSGKKSRDNFAKVVAVLLRSKKYQLPYEYDYQASAIYRVIHKKNNVLNQRMEYSSFEDYDRSTSMNLGNDGYFALLHAEELVQMGDNNIIDRETWKSLSEGMKSNLVRRRNEFKIAYPDRDPLPFIFLITLNPWNDKFPEVEDANVYHPENDFLNWAIGFDYMGILDIYKGKVGGGIVIGELKSWVDERWEDIKNSLLNNHTSTKDVINNEMGLPINTRYVRTTAFANPMYRNVLLNDELVQRFNDVYYALITGSRSALTATLGLSGNGMQNNNKRFNLPSTITYKDEDIKDRVVLGLSIGWDHDANRGPVGTPTLITGIPYRGYDENDNYVYHYKDIMVHIEPQELIQGYGSGQQGELTEQYHNDMIRISDNVYDKYFDKVHTILGTTAVFDDDDGSYLKKMVNSLEKKYDEIYKAKKHGKSDEISTSTGFRGWQVSSRDNLYQLLLETGSMRIHESNTGLLDWFKMVPNDTDGNGDKKRSTEGIWGTRMKDLSNSCDYGVYGVLDNIYDYILSDDEEGENNE